MVAAMKSISFLVRGFPAPKGSMRAAGNQVIPSGNPGNAANLRSWQTCLREAAAKAVDDLVGVGAQTIPFMGVPLRLTIEFRMQRPMGHYVKKGPNAGQLRPNAPKWPISKPDTSKLLRSTEDDLNKLVFDDDARIAETLMRKVYAAPGQEGAWIKIEELEEPGK